ncbi:hypothetical protein VTN31DRAFT_5728 [Thermomyces dupontii]|uniref:uncharacterized protein n=1 Tax=Talaromyces thermophilus TaxID=28565 RepID=UPI003741EE0A
MEDLQTLPQIPRLDKARPRSAGASQRPMRDEHLMELVRFFQMDKPPPSRYGDNNKNHNSSDGGPGPAVAATTATAVENTHHQPPKTGHRRLWQRGLTKGGTKKDKSSTATGAREEENNHRAAAQDHQRRQNALLQQNWFLPSEAAVEVEDTMWDASRPDRTRRDVEAIGRPWLDDAVNMGASSQIHTNSTRSSAERDKPAASDPFNLNDLTALFEWSVSFPEPQSGSPSRHERRSHESDKVQVGGLDQVRRGNDQGHRPQRQFSASNTLETPMAQPRRKHSNSSPAPMARRHQSPGRFPDHADAANPENGKDSDNIPPSGHASPTSQEGPTSSSSTEGQNREAKSEHSTKPSSPMLPTGGLLPPRVSSKTAMRNAFAATTLDTVVMSADEKTQGRNAISPTETTFSGSQSMPSSTPSVTQPRRLRSVTSATGQVPKKRKTSPGSQGMSLLSLAKFPHPASPPPSPAPTRPLPSVPEATTTPQPEDDQQAQPKPIDVRSRSVNSSRDKHDSPTLGANGEPENNSSQEFSAPPPPPPAQLADSSETSKRGASSARCESRLEHRSENVHALKVKDLPATPAQKRSDNSCTHFRFRSEKMMSPPGPAPSVLLPADPPVRRGSSPIPSTPVSVATCGSYEGGVSRSVSMKSSSGTESSISPRTTTSNKYHAGLGAACHSNGPRSEPSVPSSDVDEAHGGEGSSSTSTRRPSNKAHREAVPNNICSTHHSTRNKPLPPALTLADSRHSRANEKSTREPSGPASAGSQAQLIQQLEARIAALERQNRMLHAALIAALDAGVSHDADSLRSNPTSPGFFNSTNSPVQCQGGFWDAIKDVPVGELIRHGSSSLRSKREDSSTTDQASGRESWDGHGERDNLSNRYRPSLERSNSE